jgi:hypothetical protein
MEEDPTIFKDILQPLIVNPIVEGLKKQRIQDQRRGAGSDDEEELPDRVFVPQSKFCTKVVNCLDFCCLVLYMNSFS